MIKFFVGKRIPVFCFALLIIFMGINAYKTLPKEGNPEITIPYVFVRSNYAGVSATDMEALVTSRIEQELDGMDGIKKITSTSKQGYSEINLEFNSNVDISEALRKTKEKIDGMKGDLPNDMNGPYCYEYSISDNAFFAISLSHPEGLQIIDDSIKILNDEFKKISGILDIDISGRIRHELAIEIDPVKLEHYNFSMGDVENAVRNEHTTIPGGLLKSDSMDYSLSISGEIKDPAYFNELIIQNGSTKAKLKDVASVRFQVAKSSSYSRINGRPSISLYLKKRIGVNAVKMAKECRDIIERMEPLMPVGTEITITGDESKFIKNMIFDMENSMITSILLVLLVTFIFLGKTNSIFVSLAIPFSMLITFSVIKAIGITLNIYVLFSLILGLGMLVDNGIVIVENIFRHAGMGKSRLQASIDGTREVAGAIIASTITTCFAFFPIIFMPGPMGQTLSFLPKTVIILLMASLFVGLTLTPVFCSTFLKISEKAKKKVMEGSGFFAKIQNFYHKLIKISMKKPAPVVILSIFVAIAGIALFGILGQGLTFFGDEPPRSARISIEAPIGTPLDVTDKYVRLIEEIIPKTNISLQNYTIYTGSGGSHKASITVTFKDFEDRKISGDDSILALKEAFKEITGVKITVGNSYGGMGVNDISLKVTGNDYTKIGEISNSVLDILARYKELKDYSSNYEAAKPEYQIEVDREKAAFHGLSTRQIAMTVRKSINGTTVGKFRQDKNEYDIIIRFTEESRNSLNSLQNLQIITGGKRIPLSAVATIKPKTTVMSIKSTDLTKTVSISGNFISDLSNTNEIKDKIMTEIDALKVGLPKGYHIGSGSDHDYEQESTNFLGRAFLIALFLILIVLIAQFNSVADPFICLFSALLSICGVFWGFFLFQMQFETLMCGIACISLVGIAINNCIVLVDYTNLLIKNGMSWREAIPEAGKTRLRPVILTALTTVLALFPMALGLSFDLRGFNIQSGSETSGIWIAFARALISGLTFSTLMTLILVPSMLSIKHSVIEKFKNRGKKNLSNDEIESLINNETVQKKELINV